MKTIARLALLAVVLGTVSACVVAPYRPYGGGYYAPAPYYGGGYGYGYRRGYY